MKRDEAFQVILAIENDYATVGKQSLFNRGKDEHDIVISRCKERYLVEFTPKELQVDGGFQVSVDVETLRINHSHYIPEDCGPYFHFSRP